LENSVEKLTLSKDRRLQGLLFTIKAVSLKKMVKKREDTLAGKESQI